MRDLFIALGLVGILAGCQGPGYGVKDSASQPDQGKAGNSADKGSSGAEPASIIPDRTPGFSILSFSKANQEFVRKRLDPGLGKGKSQQITTFGQPVLCAPDAKGGEVCRWHDAALSEGGTVDPSMHQVFYTFDKSGVAREWDYRGPYGKLSSRDAEGQSSGSGKP